MSTEKADNEKTPLPKEVKKPEAKSGPQGAGSKSEVKEPVKSKAAAAKPRIRPVTQPRVITPEEVMSKWDAQVDVLRRYRDQQQKIGRAYRHIHQAFFKSEQNMLRFKRNLPE